MILLEMFIQLFQNNNFIVKNNSFAAKLFATTSFQHFHHL